MVNHCSSETPSQNGSNGHRTEYQLFLAGDRGTIRELKRRAHGLLRSMGLTDASVRDDLTQIAFEKMLVRSYDDQGKFIQWFFKIVANAFRDDWRKKVRETRGKEIYQERKRVLEEDQRDVLDDRGHQEIVDYTGELVAARRYSEVVSHYGRDRKFEDIADAQQSPIGTILARVHRHRAKLRSALEDRFGREIATEYE